MKRISVLVLIVQCFFGCKYFQGDECNNTKPIVGTYQNLYDDQAKNILIINEDGSFDQVFEKGSTVKKNRGFWKKSEGGECRILLSGLKVLQDLPSTAKNYFTNKGVHRFNNILFFEDYPKEFNFYRTNEDQ